MSYQHILFVKEDWIATITINNPDKMNAIHLDSMDEIIDAIKDSCDDSEVRVIVITGSGSRAFSVGYDLESVGAFAESSVDSIRESCMKFQRIPLAIRNASKPVIASVNGVAAGGSCNMALACDMIVASDEARFVEGFPHIGLHCDLGGTYLIPRLIGPAKACEFLMTRQILSAKEAERIGLINRVVPAEQLGAETKKLAKAVAEGAPLGIRLLKSTIYQALHADFPLAINIEGNAQAFCFTTEDFKEGVQAFLEKRKPVFKDK